MTLAALRGALSDAVLLLAVVFLVPVAILVVGAPLAIVVRLIVEVVNRW
jgi:hypothetical protein